MYCKWQHLVHACSPCIWLWSWGHCTNVVIVIIKDQTDTEGTTDNKVSSYSLALSIELATPNACSTSSNDLLQPSRHQQAQLCFLITVTRVAAKLVALPWQSLITVHSGLTLTSTVVSCNATLPTDSGSVTICCGTQPIASNVVKNPKQHPRLTLGPTLVFKNP